MLPGLAGNGTALILAAVAVLAARYRHDFPGRRTAEILLTGAIALMAFAGEMARTTGIGQWIASVIRWTEGLIGRDAVTVMAVATLVVVALLTRHLFRTAAVSGMWLAFALPFLLATFSGGAFHQLDVALQGPAQELAARIATALGA